jgi:hypothetical protein
MNLSGSRAAITTCSAPPILLHFAANGQQRDACAQTPALCAPPDRLNRAALRPVGLSACRAERRVHTVELEAQSGLRAAAEPARPKLGGVLVHVGHVDAEIPSNGPSIDPAGPFPTDVARARPQWPRRVSGSSRRRARRVSRGRAGTSSDPSSASLPQPRSPAHPLRLDHVGGPAGGTGGEGSRQPASPGRPWESHSSPGLSAREGFEDVFGRRSVAWSR